MVLLGYSLSLCKVSSLKSLFSCDKRNLSLMPHFVVQYFVACVDMLRKGYEIGMQMGATNEAFINLYFLIPRMIEAGMKLDVIWKEIDFFQNMAKTQ